MRLLPTSGRNRSAGSDPSGFSPAPLPSHQNGTDCRGRSESTSSRSSVESIIEEFEERRKSLERIRPTSRKHSAPDVMPRRWSQGPGESMSVGGGKLGTKTFIHSFIQSIFISFTVMLCPIRTGATEKCSSSNDRRTKIANLTATLKMSSEIRLENLACCDNCLHNRQFFRMNR